jgi:iron complex transport system substrate-binding protein
MKTTLFFSVLFLFACSTSHKPVGPSVANNNYSEWLSINESKRGVFISITNPDKSSEQFNYFIGTNTPKNYTNISVGPNGIAALSSTHIGMLSQLGSIKSISAVGDEQLIYNQELKKRISKGWVATLGQEGDLSVEMLLKSKSKTLVYSAFSGKLAIESKLKKIGIVAIPNFDWRETHPLGRAEWILLFGYLTGKQERAKKEFADIVLQYKSIQNKSKSSQKVALAGNVTGDFWYAPAGDSYNAKLLQDAGVNYIYKNSTGTGSLSLTLEQVFKKSDQVDLWLNPGFASKKLILLNNPKAKYFSMFSKGEIYCYAQNMNRYWEMAAVQPHLLLSDLQQIIDSSLPNKKLHFYQKVE